MSSLGKQLMEFIADEHLIRPHVEFQTDTGRPWTRYDWSPPDAEGKLNEFLRKHLEGKISDLSIVDGILEKEN